MAIDGTYNITVHTPRGQKEDQIVLKTDGTTLSGNYISSEMGELPINGTVNGNELQWTLIYKPEPGGEMKIPFKITIDGDKVTGKLSMEGDTPFDVVGERVS